MSANRRTLVTWSNIGATPASFTLPGGLYGVTVTGTFGPGSITLQRLCPDGSNYVTVLTAFTANGYASVELPSGTYKLLVTSVTAIYADIVGIAEP